MPAVVDKVHAFRTSVVLLAGRLDEWAALGQHLCLVPPIADPPKPRRSGAHDRVARTREPAEET
jgi:hypothetical protein